jgi:hypothetical protein
MIILKIKIQKRGRMEPTLSRKFDNDLGKYLMTAFRLI